MKRSTDQYFPLLSEPVHTKFFSLIPFIIKRFYKSENIIHRMNWHPSPFEKTNSKLFTVGLFFIRNKNSINIII